MTTQEWLQELREADMTRRAAKKTRRQQPQFYRVIAEDGSLKLETQSKRDAFQFRQRWSNSIVTDERGTVL